MGWGVAAAELSKALLLREKNKLRSCVSFKKLAYELKFINF